MAKGGISKRKQTRNFLKSGQLSSQLEARQKRKTFKQKVKGRDAKRNKGVLPIHQREEEGGGSEEEFEEVKKKRKEREESEEFEEGLDVDGVLGAEGIGSDNGEEGGDDVSLPRKVRRRNCWEANLELLSVFFFFRATLQISRMMIYRDWMMEKTRDQKSTLLNTCKI